MKIQRNHIYVVLGLMALFLLLRWGSGDDGGAAVEARAAGPRRVTRAIGGGNSSPQGATPSKVALLDLDVLAGKGEQHEPGRNLWQYGREEVVAPPPPPPRIDPPVRPPVQPPVDPGPIEPPKPQPPPVDVEFLGTFGPKARRIAVFTDGEDVLYNAFEGEVVKEAFFVEAIGFESVDLGFVGFPDASPKRLEIGK